ncbi:hypothetical protein MF271_16560 [Deinococcus sp. KNUC1210]|uniref:hypothetical protein n=1 Tax=Deinococcus sp. KNUC1210 TaxID=2917691 RepID=UPI001EEFFE96|nr:hypothetical protein [Deinococcus sp. KNUC1210]ULH15503.1 hypothetical protein MF271_16560 [Deinococcus sp. KNUC1210]
MSVFRTSWRDARLEHELRRLLTEHHSLEAAIQTLWVDGGWGMMTLAAAIEAVCELSGREAKRVVVKATFDLPHQVR